MGWVKAQILGHPSSPQIKNKKNKKKVCMGLNLANECVGGAFFAAYSSRMLEGLGVDGGRYTMVGGFVLFGADF
jgi:hypothetical protein